MKWEVFPGRGGQWYVRLRARNGQVFVVSEGYTRKADACRAARRLQLAAYGAAIVIVEK